ncbi:ribonucleoside-diphosphate reductase large subunit [Yasminevirus sp. GU-2018]|uniref:Ribonucleoside-diphosphate reductase n=1 Tax=Yasminevirus sp. GU-2018 TaxID=2420051 RepID=A0A5K0U9B6_9VIRU|nr:ribonucleoside-diphosphate reductase large subunit [Yasminevirus sp. GU-2018]
MTDHTKKMSGQQTYSDVTNRTSYRISSQDSAQHAGTVKGNVSSPDQTDFLIAQQLTHQSTEQRNDGKVENNTYRLKRHNSNTQHILVMNRKAKQNTRADQPATKVGVRGKRTSVRPIIVRAGKKESLVNNNNVADTKDVNSSVDVNGDNAHVTEQQTAQNVKNNLLKIQEMLAKLQQAQMADNNLTSDGEDVDDTQTKIKKTTKKQKKGTQTKSSTNDQLSILSEMVSSLIKSSDNDSTMKEIDALMATHFAKTPSVYTESRRHKHVGFGDSSFGQIYAGITQEHDVQIKITQTFVRNFLKGFIAEIKEHNNEKLPKCINLDVIVKNIADSLPKSMDTDAFYGYISEYLVAKSSQHYYYDLLASRIAMKRLHNITTPDFLMTAKLLQENLDKNNDRSPILSDETFDIISRHHIRLQEAIKYDRDYVFDFFGIKTLERSYLYKLHFTKFKIIERPQHMIMRVAIGIHGEDIDSAIETYDLISQKYFTHATPTLFNAGTKRAQMSSCFLQAIDDSIESIFEAVRDIAFTSKWSGGIGVHMSALRSRGSLIRGTNGLASGIIPLCVLLNKLAKYINQGGKRNGSIACYLEPHHADIFDFCDLRKNTGNDDNRARDLYLALWVSSLFMKRVKEDAMWSLMCPDECPGLNQVHGDEYVKLYEKYESEGRYVKQVKARDLWRHILEAQSETGFPYILYKDNANKKSNQKNLGTIRSSNLCAEIIQYSDEKETAVCNLASLCLPMFIETDENGNKTYNFEKLAKVCRVAVRNLDKIIDRNYYPTEKTQRSNLRHRPMGIGVQGLADVYNIMGYGFSTPSAYELNNRIFETIYYACIDESKELAKRFGPYSTFKGSPASQGQLQFHMWGVSEDQLLMGYDWKKLVEEVKKYGLRNSLLTALMPTASTSQIMGNSECIEPYMSNIFKRSTLAGEFIVINKNLMKDLIELNLWDDDMRKRIIIENGSVQNIESVPDKLKKVYETAFETKQMHIVRQSADRGKFIDQSQSLNLFMAEPDFDILTSALFESHDLGNKTGMYYYRSLPAINPINFGIDVEDIKRLTGRDTTLEVLTGGYNIDRSDNKKNDDATVKRVVSKRKAKDDAQDGSPSQSGQQTVEPGMCKYRPGMKLEDCLSCGS